MKKKVAIIMGTRPEAIKLVPVYLAMQNSNLLQPILVSTGQHKEMIYQIFDFFKVKPEIELAVMLKGQTLTGLTARITERLGEFMDKEQPDAVLVQGDTTTAFVAGLVGFYNKIPVGHVEAGLRTYDKYSPFPEEVNRKMISAFASWNFAPTPKAVEVLKQENIDAVHCVGNTVIDSLLICHKKVKANLKVYQDMFKEVLDEDKKIVLVTGHRRESFGEGFQNICNAIRSLAERYKDRLFVYPVHLNPVVQKVVYESLGEVDNVKLIDPLPYDQLIYIMSQSEIILTDSGGIQEEGPTFNVPIVVMREKTEREEGVEAGCAVLAGTKTENIVATFSSILDKPELYEKMAAAANPYGDGTSAQQIVQLLEEYYSNQ